MIGKIVEAIRVNPGTASQYEPGDVGAVDSQNLQRKKCFSKNRNHSKQNIVPGIPAR